MPEEAESAADLGAEEPRASDYEPEPAPEEPAPEEAAAGGLRGAAAATAPYGLGDDDRDATW